MPGGARFRGNEQMNEYPTLFLPPFSIRFLSLMSRNGVIQSNNMLVSISLERDAQESALDGNCWDCRRSLSCESHPHSSTPSSAVLSMVGYCRKRTRDARVYKILWKTWKWALTKRYSVVYWSHPFWYSHQLQARASIQEGGDRYHFEPYSSWNKWKSSVSIIPRTLLLWLTVDFVY